MGYDQLRGNSCAGKRRALHHSKKDSPLDINYRPPWGEIVRGWLLGLLVPGIHRALHLAAGVPHRAPLLH
jgi:hypothetical protein